MTGNRLGSCLGLASRVTGGRCRIEVSRVLRVVGRIRCSRPRDSRSGAPEWLLGRDRPDEAGELASAGNDDLLVGFATAGHPLPALVEALLAAPGALDHDGVLAALAAGELVADLRPPARVPGRLDQQPTHMAVADLGDRALPSLLARGVLAGHEADEGHQLLRGPEAVEV